MLEGSAGQLLEGVFLVLSFSHQSVEVVDQVFVVPGRDEGEERCRGSVAMVVVGRGGVDVAGGAGLVDEVADVVGDAFNEPAGVVVALVVLDGVTGFVDEGAGVAGVLLEIGDGWPLRCSSASG